MRTIRHPRSSMGRAAWLKRLSLAFVAILAASCSAPLDPGTPAASGQISAPTAESSVKTPTIPPKERSLTTQPSPTSVELVYLPDLKSQDTDTPQPSKPATDPNPLCSPLAIHPLEELREIISDPYHPPPPGREERHQGVDFSYYRRGERTTIQGVGVQAVFPGRVAASIQEKFPYGNMLIIETLPELLSPELREMLQIPAEESLYTLYAHLNKPPLVSLDERVESCQAIGEVGKSGNAAEPHLHLEMRLGPSSHSFLSMAYYGAKDTQAERDEYVLWRTSWQFRHFDPMSVLGLDSDSTK